MTGTDNSPELVARLRSMMSRFGRAETDLAALCTRAETGDYRGVLQNSRVICEVLLRAIVAKELGHEPGKMMLEKLINMIGQQKSERTIPPNIMTHVRSVHAFGNLGAHDHDGDLFDASFEVTREDAVSALNSVSAILSWYDNKYLTSGSASSGRPPSSEKSNASATAKREAGGGDQASAGWPPLRWTKYLVIGVAVAAGAGAAWHFTREPPKPGGAPRAAPAASEAEVNRSALDRLLKLGGDPLPPTGCRLSAPTLIAKLQQRASSLLEGENQSRRQRAGKAAIVALRDPETELQQAAEYWYLNALAKYWAKSGPADVAAAASKATSRCQGFAAAHKVAGSAHLLAKAYAAAASSFQSALEAEPSYLAARFNLALTHLAEGRTAPAIQQLTLVIEQDASFPDAYRVRGQALVATRRLEEAQQDLESAVKQQKNDATSWLLLGQVSRLRGDPEGANAAFCKATELGSEQATPLCKP